jgi:D-amino peptidase
MRPNLVFSELHPDAQLIMGGRGADRPALVMESMDESYDLALLVGFHAAAHYAGGIISHSYHLPTNFFEVRINGMPVGEPEIATALAGHFGVPCGLITGDDVTINEYRNIVPNAESVIVKWALDRTAARCLTLAKTGAMIRDAARRAVERGKAREFAPWTFEPPLRLEITCANYGLANKLSGVPGAERVDRRIVGFSSNSYADLYRALMIFTYLTTTSADPGPTRS